MAGASVWDGAQAAIDALQGRTKLAVVTNCSVRLGRVAAARLNVRWDAVVTAEEAGCYKPDPKPYRLALSQLSLAPQEAAFVAGSGYDLFGTSVVGLRTYWHNRVGLARPDGAPPASLERSTLQDLLPGLKEAKRESQGHRDPGGVDRRAPHGGQHRAHAGPSHRARRAPQAACEDLEVRRGRARQQKGALSGSRSRP